MLRVRPVHSEVDRRCHRSRVGPGSRSGALVLVSALLACDGAEGAAAGEQVHEKNAAAQPRPVPAFDLGPAHYHLQLTARSELDQQLAGEFGFTLDADLTLHPKAEGADLELLAVTREARFTNTRGGGTESFERVASELQQPFGWTLRDGQVTHLRLRAGLSNQTVGIVRSLVSLLQFPNAAERAQPMEDGSVEISEHDGTGRYRVRYRWTDSGLDKQRLRFEHLITAGNLDRPMRQSVMPRVVRSQGRLQLRGQVLTEASLDEVLESELALDKRLTVHSKLRLTRSEPPQGAQAAADWSALSTAEVVPVDAAYAKTAQPDRFDALRAEGADLNQVLAELKKQYETQGKTLGHDRSEAPEQARARLPQFSTLVPLLRTDPKGVETVETWIRRGDGLGRQLLDALSSAGTPQAQAALLRLVQNAETPKEQRLLTATSLIRTKRPSPEVVRFLEEHLEDPLLGEHALFGLGTAARRLGEQGDGASAARLAQRLVRLLEKSKEPQARTKVLRAIANSGHSAAYAAAAAHLRDDDAAVRQAAVDAIRLMPGAEVDASLAERLRGDDSLNVRKAVVRNLRLREPTEATASALAAVAVEATEHSLRHDAVRRLVQWLPKRPELRAALESAAQKETVQQTKALAVEALQAGD